MNIFVTSPDPVECAQCLPDKHVVKMPLETCQMLSIVCSDKWGHGYGQLHRINGEPYKTDKGAFRNHPCTIWANKTLTNTWWLVSHGIGLCQEYTHRYGKIHSTNALLNDVLSNAPKNIKQEGWREPPPAMQHYPQCIVQGDSIQSYKNYYNEAKAYFAKWSKREQPEWFVGSMT